MLLAIMAQFSACNTPTNQTGSDQVEEEIPVDSADIRSELVYQTYCASCHGEQMMAFADRRWIHGNDRDSLIASINTGYTEAGMPSWGDVLSDTQITEMADYILKGIEHVEQYGFEEIVLTSDTFETTELTFSLDTVASGLNIPWGMAILPSGEMLVTEKKGTLYLVSPTGDKTIVKGAPKVRYDSQGGLLDVVLHPEFETNNWVYISFSDFAMDGGDTISGTAVNRYTYDNGNLTEMVEIFKGTPYTTMQYHYGSRIAFDEAGYLYLTASDRAARDDNPQDLSNPKGKIHRLNDDGSIPADNPFVGTDSVIQSIYSYGHRNAQGMVWNNAAGKLYAHEHGPRGGDEINLIQKGINYGWPVISYGINYDGTSFTTLLEKEGMEQPLHYWVPSIAPSGMAFVESDKYPGWEGNLMVGSLRYKYLNRVVMDGDKVVSEEPLMKNIGRLRNVILGPDGYLYISVEDPGYVFRLVPLEE